MFGKTFKKVATGAIAVAALGASQVGSYAKQAADAKRFVDKAASGSAKIVRSAAKGGKK
jgi:hypothetical protein